MTDKELLQAMSDMLQPILSEMQGMKEKLNEIDKKVDTIDKKVDRNHDLTLEFYGNQKEHNTEVSTTLDSLGARQEIFENQIVKNTADLKRIK